MVGPQVEQIVLELSAGEPISGRVVAADGSSEPFRGWLELAGKLERRRPLVTSADGEQLPEDR